MNQASPRLLNPHFDHDRVVWSDEYSGQYEPADYGSQFDEEWRLFLEKKIGFHKHTGVETSDSYIDDRIYELTGVRGYLERQNYSAQNPLVKWLRIVSRAQRRRGVGGRLFLDPKFSIDFFKDKFCLDIGCGAGRWTRTMLELGAKVKSVDLSKNALKSMRRFNDDVEELNLFDIIEKRPDLHGAFDFTLCWGVVMCTHDPRLAFENVSRTVKPGGHLYAMIYAPTYHNSPFVLRHRRYYHKNLTTMDEKLRYTYDIADRPENAINLLDMLNTFYNWTVPEEVIYQWYHRCGFEDVVTLNHEEPHKCAYHVLGRKCA